MEDIDIEGFNKYEVFHYQTVVLTRYEEKGFAHTRFVSMSCQAERRAFLAPKRDSDFHALERQATRYHEIKARQYSGTQTIKTISRLGMPGMFRPIQNSVEVLYTKPDCNGRQTLLCHKSHILR